MKRSKAHTNSGGTPCSAANWELRSPTDFDTATRFVRPEDMRESLLISSNPNQHVDWLSEFIELGF